MSVALTVNTMGGDSLKLAVPAAANIAQLKQQICDEGSGIPPVLQQLFMAGDEDPLAEASLASTLADRGGILFMMQFDGPPTYLCPGSTMAGAHTDNPQYFSSGEGGLVLNQVCWLQVRGQFKEVCPGKYAVELEFETTSEELGFSMDVKVTSPSIQTGAAALGDWAPAARPEAERSEPVRTNVLGEIDMQSYGDIDVVFTQTEGGWKSGLTWKSLTLRRI
jgi:hypothetical protein